MTQVLIKISKGIIEQVVFFDDPEMAIQALSKYVNAMNVEHDDAAVYDCDGMMANAKHFLNDHDEYVQNQPLIEEVSKQRIEPIYIIGNPQHYLGFMVVSSDDPLGYDNAVEALSELGQMRQDSGNHLKLYRVMPVNGPVAHSTDLEKYNADCDVEDFDYSLIQEYLWQRNRLK